MKKSALFIIIFLLNIIANIEINGQTIHAIVADKESREAIPDVFVFLDNSALGTITDERGQFVLKAKEYKNITLVFSHLNYELSSLLLKNPQSIKDTIFLNPNDLILEEVVVVKKYKPRVRTRWMKKFRPAFLGKDYDKELVKILNPEVLLFENKKSKLIANSKEALVIENKMLGYRVRFFLESFELYKNADLLYNGKVFFEEMEGTKKEKAKFKRNRSKVYQRTSRSFFTALINQKIEVEHYKVGYSILNKNGDFSNFESIAIDSIEVKELADNEYEIDLKGVLTVTSNHFRLQQPMTQKLPSTFSTGIDNYKGKQNNIARSYLWAKNWKVFVNQFGTILNPIEVEEAGYWAGLRVAALLPFDYEPRKRKSKEVQ